MIRCIHNNILPLDYECNEKVPKAHEERKQPFRPNL